MASPAMSAVDSYGEVFAVSSITLYASRPTAPFGVVVDQGNSTADAQLTMMRVFSSAHRYQFDSLQSGGIEYFEAFYNVTGTPALLILAGDAFNSDQAAQYGETTAWPYDPTSGTYTFPGEPTTMPYARISIAQLGPTPGSDGWVTGKNTSTDPIKWRWDGDNPAQALYYYFEVYNEVSVPGCFGTLTTFLTGIDPNPYFNFITGAKLRYGWVQNSDGAGWINVNGDTINYGFYGGAPDLASGWRGVKLPYTTDAQNAGYIARDDQMHANSVLFAGPHVVQGVNECIATFLDVGTATFINASQSTILPQFLLTYALLTRYNGLWCRKNGNPAVASPGVPFRVPFPTEVPPFKLSTPDGDIAVSKVETILIMEISVEAWMTLNSISSHYLLPGFTPPSPPTPSSISSNYSSTDSSPSSID